MTELPGAGDTDDLLLIAYDFAGKGAHRWGLGKRPRRSVGPKNLEPCDDRLDVHALDVVMVELAQRRRVGIRIALLRIREIDLLSHGVEERRQPFALGAIDLQQSFDLSFHADTGADIHAGRDDGVFSDGKEADEQI